MPPVDGSLHPLHGLTDWQAEHNPARPFAIFPKDGASGPAMSISYLEFAYATHRMAHALRPNGIGDDGEVVAIIVNCDTLLYQTLFVGMARTGWVVRSSFFYPLHALDQCFSAIPHVSQKFSGGCH